MVDEAKKKNVYKDYIIKAMSAEPTSIKEGECNPTSMKELKIVIFLHRIQPQLKKVTVNMFFDLNSNIFSLTEVLL